MGGAVSKGLLRVAGIDVGVQVACWAVAAALHTEKFYDLSGSCTYLLLLASTMRLPPAAFDRSTVNSCLVATWALRLGTFLITRIMRDGKDKRFDKVRDKPLKFLVFWLIQALWIFLTALPVWVVNCKRGEWSRQRGDGREAEPPVGWRDRVGWAVWVVGFLLQVVADRQKSAFRANPANAERWIDEGLWHYSQHPNYFGEMTMWWGIFLSCSTALRGGEWASAASPLFVMFLLTQVSGVPLLRKANMRRWGSDPQFQQYLKTTSLLVPMPKMG